MLTTNIVLRRAFIERMQIRLALLLCPQVSFFLVRGRHTGMLTPYTLLKAINNRCKSEL